MAVVRLHADAASFAAFADFIDGAAAVAVMEVLDLLVMRARCSSIRRGDVGGALGRLWSFPGTGGRWGRGHTDLSIGLGQRTAGRASDCKDQGKKKARVHEGHKKWAENQPTVDGAEGAGHILFPLSVRQARNGRAMSLQVSILEPPAVRHATLALQAQSRHHARFGTFFVFHVLPGLD